MGAPQLEMLDQMRCFQTLVMNEVGMTTVVEFKHIAAPKYWRCLVGYLMADLQDGWPGVFRPGTSVVHDYVIVFQDEQLPDHVPYLRRKGQEAKLFLFHAWFWGWQRSL